MSVWDNYGTGTGVPPGTPDIRIRYVQAGPSGNPAVTYTEDHHVVTADGEPVHRCPEYREAHRWAQNKYGLTSTPMTAVYADYSADFEARFAPMFEKDGDGVVPEVAAKPNKYRKEGK